MRLKTCPPPVHTGADGARRVRRAERGHYEFAAGSGDAERVSLLQKHVKMLCLQIMQLKSDYYLSQEAVAAFLSILHGCPLVHEEGRKCLPLNFKALLTALEQFGVPPSYLWEYDMCPCSHIFRCAL